MKILALANCNGLVIKQVLEAIGHEVDHIVPTAQTAETVTEEAIQRYDVILAQGVQRRLPQLWDRVSAHPRCLIFPYIVFNGFTPDRLAIVPRSPAAGGGWGNIPRIMATAWKRGLPQAETCRLYNPEFLDLMGYQSEFAALKQLFLKDLSRNMTNPEAHFAHWFDRGVFFFTGNHPRSFVVEDILRSVLEPLELELPAACLSDLLPDPLAANDRMPSLNHPMATNRLDRPDQIYKVGPRLRTLPEMVAGIYHRLQKASDAVEIPQRDLERFDTALHEWSDRKPEPTTNPYTKIPAHRFWSRSVARLSPADVSPGHDLTPIIDTKSRVATAGSCFAQHVAKALVKSGLTYYVAEPAPDGMDKETADARGYGLFSARYGNIYSTRQLRQLVDRAYGRFTPIETAWRVKDGYIDPFRPNIGETFASVAAVETARETHMAHVRQMLETLDVFVFTLGLTEGWFDRRDGAAFPVTPGSVTSAANPANFEFQNLGYAEVKDDLLAFLAALKTINPKAKVIFTVSPVPLIATYSETDALSATCYSKSVLRAAAEDVSRQFPNVQYFPSFEIITGAYNRGAYFAPDLRQVTPDGVAHVMRVFLKRLVRGSASTGDDAPLAAGEVHTARMNEMIEELSEQKAIICDEELHEKDR